MGMQCPPKGTAVDQLWELILLKLVHESITNFEGIMNELFQFEFRCCCTDEPPPHAADQDWAKRSKLRADCHLQFYLVGRHSLVAGIRAFYGGGCAKFDKC